MWIEKRRMNTMLIFCPECSHSISDKAIACPSCGYPINLLPEPQKPSGKPRKARGRHRKLPNGTGSIKKLSGKRTRPYAAYPPATEFNLNGSPKPVPAIGYFEDWVSAWDALREYNKNPYNPAQSELTFADVYEMYYQDKFVKNQKRKFSIASMKSTQVAFKNASALHKTKFLDLRKADLQNVIDNCPLKHASLELIVTLFKQMYRFAIQNDITSKDYAQFVTINIADDDESGVPFSQEELDILWKHSDLPAARTTLLLIYSGFRIKALETLEINLDEQYFRGGVKTKAGKGRIVPIHRKILPFAEEFRPDQYNAVSFRTKEFYPLLEQLGISASPSGQKHTPHDCRHTFSWLCDKYGVNDLSKHLLMGHSLGNDVEKSVYGHRTLDELRAEIAKIDF